MLSAGRVSLEGRFRFYSKQLPSKTRTTSSSKTNQCNQKATLSKIPSGLKVGTHDGSSPCNWSLRLVASCELAIFAS